jgi:phage shock protein PspC (stress-responsive transcriptional regulator)
MNTDYKQLTRSTTDRMIAGVCAGIGKYANIDPTVVRLIAVLLFFLGMGPGILLAYFIMMIIVPEEPTTTAPTPTP